MSIWIILSWVFVLVLTAVNIVVFLKLKQASEQMLKMAFPNAKNMNEALGQMQGMMAGMQGMQGMKNVKSMQGAAKGFRPAPGSSQSTGSQDAQLKAAMDMLKQMQQGRKK